MMCIFYFHIYKKGIIICSGEEGGGGGWGGGRGMGKGGRGQAQLLCVWVTSGDFVSIQLSRSSSFREAAKKGFFS